MIVAFLVWEAYAPYPMFPRRLRQDPRILALTLVITFISGANFFSILMFWPTQAFNVYGHDPVGVGKFAEVEGVEGSMSLMMMLFLCRRPRTSCEFRYPWRSCHRSVAAFSLPRPQQGAHDCIVRLDDSGMWRPFSCEGGQLVHDLGAAVPCGPRDWRNSGAGVHHQ